MSQNPDLERQKVLEQFEQLINTYYVAVGKQNALFEDFKTSSMNILNQLFLENQSLKAHLKALEKTSANTNMEPGPSGN